MSKLPETTLAINPQKRQNQIKMKITRDIRIFQCKIFHDGYDRSQIISRMKRPLHVHRFLGTRIQNGLQKWQKDQGSTVFLFTDVCLRTKITKKYLAEDALTELYHVQRSLLIWLQMITKSWTRNKNHVTIIDTLLCFKILWLNGFSLNRAKARLPRKQKKCLRKFLESSKIQRSFTLTILWNLQNLVKIYLGIIGRQHLIDQKQMILLNEQYEESKKEQQLFCYSQDYLRDGDLISSNAVAICDMSKTSQRTGKLLKRDDSENH